MQPTNFWKPSLEIYLFGNNKNINCQIKFALNSPYIYLTQINQFFIPEMKYVVRGNVRSGKCHSRNYSSGKCPFGELTVRETVLWGTIHQGNVFEELTKYQINKSGVLNRDFGMFSQPENSIQTMKNNKKLVWDNFNIFN